MVMVLIRSPYRRYLMTSLAHHITPDAWTTEILPCLPADLEAQAHALHALVRHRGFTSASDLLRGLLQYAATHCSLRQLGIWGLVQDVADLAPSSWLERLRAAGPWLQWLVASMLHQPRPRWLLQPVRGRVLLIDATCLDHWGGSGDDWRLHLAYDLLAARLDQVVLTDGHGAEHVHHFGFQPGDLAVFDGGYGYRERVTHLRQQQVDCVIRIYPPTFPLQHDDGRPFDVRAWLDQSGAAQRECVVCYQHAQQRWSIRVLALRLDERRRQSARSRARERARKRQRALSDLVQYFADWIVLVTTLDALTWPAAAIWRLYGARWQVELLIKRCKQFVGLGQLRCRTPASLVALIWALLLLWVLHEPLAGDVQRSLQQLADPAPATLPGQWPAAEAVVSTWGVSQLLLSTLRQAIAGTWTLARVQACLGQLRRYLVTHPRDDREHQASEVVAWLSGVRRTRRRPLPDAE